MTLTSSRLQAASRVAGAGGALQDAGAGLRHHAAEPGFGPEPVSEAAAGLPGREEESGPAGGSAGAGL